MINTLLNQDFVAMDKFRLRKIFGKITEIRVKMNKTNKSKRNDSCMGYFLSSPFSSLIADLAAGGSAGEFASLALDKRDSLESKLLRASSEKNSCLQETVSSLNQCIGEENQGRLQTTKN